MPRTDFANLNFTIDLLERQENHLEQVSIIRARVRVRVYGNGRTSLSAEKSDLLAGYSRLVLGPHRSRYSETGFRADRYEK